MKARGWVVLRRRLMAKGLLLSACLLWPAARLYAQREVIATSVPVVPSPQTAPAPQPPPAPPPSEIQPVSYVPNTAPASPRPMLALPPTVSAGEPAANPSAPVAVPAATPAASLLSVEVVGSDRLPQGQALTHEIVVRNRGTQPCAEIHVEEPLPVGVQVVRSEPAATQRDNRLTWDLRQLEAGGERRLRVEMNLGSLREVEVRPIVTFSSGAGLHTRILRPPFAVEISADQTKVMRGERIHFTIRLANNGEEPIRNIKLYDTLPPALHHPLGPKMLKSLGDLPPGETKTITLDATGVASGPFRNEVRVQADFGVEANAVLEGVVSEPSLSLRLEGPTRTDTLHDVDFRLEVANGGTVTARNVKLVQTLPPALAIVSATSGAALDNGGHALVWSLSDVKVGERQTLMFRCRATLGGDWPLTAAVMSQNLAPTRVESMLHAESSASLKLEPQAREERLAVGAETIYRLRVFNKGDAASTGLRLIATLPDTLTPLKTEGPSEGRIDNQQVSFAPLPRLEGHGDVVYRLHVRGRQAGKGMLRIELSADKQNAVVNEMHIQVENQGEIANSLAGETLR
jgi:uncharacterized repeat protein (TIGR01451 family)